MTETVDFGALNPAGGPNLAFTLVVEGTEGSQRFRLRGNMSLGKSSDNDIVIDGNGISRHHLELLAEPNSVHVKDSNSKNGTFYNGARITEVRVGAGARLRVGGPAGLEIQIELENQPTITPSEEHRFGPLIGSSIAMRSVYTILERTAPSTATILVNGETGTGKELVAQAIHEASPRKDKPLVIIDCGSIPTNLIESELFGHVKGAFTDAHSDRSGAFEAANGGTLFLDEIGELPLDLQPKLLRAVEGRSIQRLGESTRRDVDVRLVAATHRDLQVEVQDNRFRQDLFYRLAVVSVKLPPLRERGSDVIKLAEHILGQLGQADAINFDGNIAQALMSYSWPGNVRELRNALERAIHLGAEHAIPMAGPGHQNPRTFPEDAPDLPFKEAKEQIVMSFERAYIERLMGRHTGNISAASRDAGIDRNYLYRLLKKHDLEK